MNMREVFGRFFVNSYGKVTSDNDEFSIFDLSFERNMGKAYAAVTIKPRGNRRTAGMALTPEAARQVGRQLIRFAKMAERGDFDDDSDRS